MSELAKLYEVLKSATVAQVLAFAALIVPGLVALRAYEAKRGGEPRKRIVKEQLSLAAVITLRDGRRVAGRLVEPAYVSTYPAPEQILLGEMWRVDQTSGTFIERMRGSWGMLIDKADCETIEFIRWSELSIPLVRITAC